MHTPLERICTLDAPDAITFLKATRGTDHALLGDHSVRSDLGGRSGAVVGHWTVLRTLETNKTPTRQGCKWFHVGTVCLAA